MKRRFTEWYSQGIWKGLESGQELNDIDTKLTLTILKPLHASWLADLYNYLTSQKRAEIIFNGRESFGITEAIAKDTKDLENLDPFVSVDPLEHDDTTECLQDYSSLQTSEESNQMMSGSMMTLSIFSKFEIMRSIMKNEKVHIFFQ